MSGGNLASPGGRLARTARKRPCLEVVPSLLRRGYGTHVDSGLVHAGQRVEEGHGEVSSVSAFGIIKNTSSEQFEIMKIYHSDGHLAASTDRGCTHSCSSLTRRLER
jgi:hypothetical protein